MQYTPLHIRLETTIYIISNKNEFYNLKLNYECIDYYKTFANALQLN